MVKLQSCEAICNHVRHSDISIIRTYTSLLDLVMKKIWILNGIAKQLFKFGHRL